MRQFIDILECNRCGGSFVRKKNKLICLDCGFSYGYDNEIIKTIPILKNEKVLSHQKWEDFYEKWIKENSYLSEFEEIKKIMKRMVVGK